MPRPYLTKRDEADVFRALAHPGRRKMIAAALDAPCSFDHLRRLLRRSDATVAAHLRILREARLIMASRDGRYVLYRTNRRALRSGAKWFAEIAGMRAAAR